MSRLLVLVAIAGFVGCHSGVPSREVSRPIPSPPDADDPPARVGRLALIEGAVSFRPAASDTWAVPQPNRAVTTGDRLWVDSVGHAEVEIGPSALRVARQTEVDFVHLDDDMLQVRVPQGSVDLRIKQIDIKQDYEVDAPNAAIVLEQDGEYRIDASVSGDTTRVTTWSGHAQVTADGSTFPVDAGQTASVRGDSAPTYDLAGAGPLDDFDRWARARNDREDRVSASARYVSADMGGIEDLDVYGTWAEGPDCGPVWFPTTVAAGWAPYAFGHWVWIDPWGWTWVDDYPWGWAPFHYGRWAYIGGAWGWCPGPVIYEPVWAPALVVFVGGPTWGPGVGWFPLGPHEPFFPHYRTGVRYRERVNVTNATTVTNVTGISYRNRTVPGAVTVVPARAFAGGEPVGRSALHPSTSQLGTAGVLDAGPSVAPTPRSLVGAGGAGPAVAPPSRLATRSVAALHAPPPTPMRFSTEERALVADGGRPLTESERASLRAANPTARGAPPPLRSAATPAVGGRALAPARSGLTQPLPVSRGVVTRPVRTPLDESFRNERRQLETRHIQEFARPSPAESREDMFRRQQAQRRALITRYDAARSAHMTRMPAPPRGGGHRP